MLEQKIIKTSEKSFQQDLPYLPISTIWLISFGFLGVQMAFSLQSSNMGRIFQTIGADPTTLGFFFILPPLAGLVVQPLVGYFSDRTWIPKLGRRIPYLLIGAIVAVIVMCLLPNAGSFGFSAMAAMTFGAITILFMDLSSNVAMQPFKMMVGDMVNEDQKGFAYSIQSFLSNSGAVLACIFPFILTVLGVSNSAPTGVVPQSVVISFYVGAIVLIICSLFTIFKVKEYSPAEFAAYHGITNETNKENVNVFKLLRNAPKVFWTVTLVQFFCWMGFQYLWTYGTGAVALNVWHAIEPSSSGYQAAGNWFGILSAVQSIAAVLWSLILSRVRNNKRKPAYALSLLLGGIGFGSVFFIHNQWVLIVSFILIGIAWAAMMTFPFTMLTNALSGKNMGTYLGLFNGSICLPQIIASCLSFSLFPAIGSSMSGMILISGILLVMGAVSVSIIKETYAK
ncbi:SLC45 family MFS transporter [Priestia aryabhattai]|uniref:SLC45 family MFS transporter n=1 Tax=Priestia aryabhattai TaxID=412384 RepID=UPI0024531817|nr:SLC45 family MFS transporter [Priestia aryabhattai]MDH3111119.1 SLC45 family MFS transporter [Priestia aryabhattai]MDH3129788.1 SLC45 family MFS transporter [Priestia aryabhattai]MDH3130264.1 SLC45 family MFS transporter [Priestia aryabhattai]